MDRQLERHCVEALHATSIKELLKIMIAFSEERGFWRVSATVITQHSPTLREHQYLTNASEEYMPEFEDMAAAHVDPVSQHAAIKSTPLAWNQSTYVNNGQSALWERQAPWGYRSGIVIGLHLPRGKHFLFGPDNDRPNCGTPAQIERLKADIVHFATFAQASACELSTNISPHPDRLGAPTRGELEVLRWCMDGLLRWEVGEKMGLSALDVERRLHRVSKKLGCSTTYETVLRAIKLGFIKCV